MKIYVAHPYGGDEKNKKIVELFIKKLVEVDPGITFISPIHAFGYLYDTLDYETGIDMCLDLMENCDALLIPPFSQIENSKGCLVELGYAKGKGLKILSWLDVIDNRIINLMNKEAKK